MEARMDEPAFAEIKEEIAAPASYKAT